MVKKFYAVLDVEDDSSRDEIEVVPFVKPTPVVIDLDLSSDEEEGHQVRTNGEVKGETPRGPPISSNPVDKVSGGRDGDIKNVDTTGDVTIDVVVVLNDAVASPPTAAPTSDSSPTLPEIRIAQSIFETEEVPEVLPVGGKTNNKDPLKMTPKKPGKVKDPKSTAKRKRLSSAGSGGRTAEEIQKLLTTLGVLGDQQQQKETEEAAEEEEENPKKKSKKTYESSNSSSNSTSRSTSPQKKPRKSRVSSIEDQLPLTVDFDADGDGDEERTSRMPLQAIMAPPEVPSMLTSTGKKRGRQKKNQTTSIVSTSVPPQVTLSDPLEIRSWVEGLDKTIQAVTSTATATSTSTSPFVSVEEECRGNSSPPKKTGKKRSRNHMEKPSPFEDTEITAEELAGVNLHRIITNVISTSTSTSNSPHKKKQRTRPSEVEDSVESISVVVGEGQRVVRISAQNDVSANVNANVPSTSKPPEMNYLPSTWTQEMVSFYDTPKDEYLSMSQVLNRLSGDRRLWTIPSGLPPKGKLKRIRCENCKQWGHVKRLCPDPPKVVVCIFCGLKGHDGGSHCGGINRRTFCRKTMCLNCGKNQNRFSGGCEICTFTRNPPVCSLCKLEGHKTAACPDHWRRFHSTTSVAYVANEDGVEEPLYSNGNLTKAEYREKRQTFCANCGRKGHLFHMCRSRMHHRLTQYNRQKPFIYKELVNSTAVREKRAIGVELDVGVGVDVGGRRNRSTPDSQQTLSATATAQRKVTVQEEVREDPETIRIIISNSSAAAPETITFFQGETWKCANHPECSNTPSLGQSCHTMFLVPGDHAALFDAQERRHLGLENVKTSNQVQIAVLKERHVAHIFGYNHVRAKEEILELVKELRTSPEDSCATLELQNVPKTSSQLPDSSKNTSELPNSSKNSSELPPNLSETSKKSTDQSNPSMNSPELPEVSKNSANLPETSKASPKPPAVPETLTITDSQGNSSSTDFDESKPPSPPDLPTPDEEIIVLPPERPPTPEIITLEDSEDSEEDSEDVPRDFGTVGTETSSSEEVLSVSLLPSEWDLIFPHETFKRDLKDDQGILTLLATTFSVSVFVSKESYTVTIRDGETEGRILAKENLVFWLECQAGGVAFCLQYEKRQPRDTSSDAVQQHVKRGKNYERNRRRRENRLKSQLKKLLNENKRKEEQVQGQGTERQGQGPPRLDAEDATGQVQQPPAPQTTQRQEIPPQEFWTRDLEGDGRFEAKANVPGHSDYPGSSGNVPGNFVAGGGRSGYSRSRGQGGNQRFNSRWDSPRAPQAPPQRPTRYFNANF